MPELLQLHVDGLDWAPVKARALERGSIYTSPDGSLFLRTGDQERVHEEASFARSLHDSGFPTPEVVGEGATSTGTSYFIEKSLGNETFFDMFSSEAKSSGAVSDTTFARFCGIASSFLSAQLSNAVNGNEQSGLREGIHLDNVIKENPDIDRALLLQAYTKAETKVRTLPLVLTHGDFGPTNILPGGVIDFEHKFIAPVGFDVLTSLYVGRFWNFITPDGVNHSYYDFDDDQTSQYVAAMDKVAKGFGIEQFSQYTDDFVMLKAIWVTSFEKQIAVQIGHNYTWENKKATLKYCLEQYLSGRSIETKTFGKHLKPVGD